MGLEAVGEQEFSLEHRELGREKRSYAAVWCFAEYLPPYNNQMTLFKFLNREKAANMTSIEKAVKVNKYRYLR